MDLFKRLRKKKNDHQVYYIEKLLQVGPYQFYVHRLMILDREIHLEYFLDYMEDRLLSLSDVIMGGPSADYGLEHFDLDINGMKLEFIKTMVRYKQTTEDLTFSSEDKRLVPPWPQMNKRRLVYTGHPSLQEISDIQQVHLYQDVRRIPYRVIETNEITDLVFDLESP